MLRPLGKKELPKAPPLLSLIGPSFIILGVGLGSGELILWPYLASNFGLGLVWAAILGISFQFVINMEIERYTLATGESIFVGLTRKFGRFAPVWFIITTFLPWMWPGIAASAAKLVSSALQIQYSPIVGIVLLALIGLVFSLGRIVYKTQELFQKTIIILGVPFIFLVTLIFAKSHHWQDLLLGLGGIGTGYWGFPKDLPFSIFLAAFAYAGAGGNLNLAQSLYIKEKGYGMGIFSDKITNIFKGKQSSFALEGNTFDTTKTNLDNFKIWWRRINIEHGMVFWLTGAFTMLLLSLLSYSTVYKTPGVETSINFVIKEGSVIGQSTAPILGSFFLVMAALMLFGTQFSVFGSNSRIMAENLVLVNQNRFKPANLSKFFYGFLWLQILAGIAIFSLGFSEPLTLVVIGAVLNALSMFVYSGMVLFINHTLLPIPLRPSLVRTTAVLIAFVFYGGFCLYTILQRLGAV